MPQSSEEMYELMRFIAGGESGIEDHPPQKFLEGRGYRLLPNWTWQLPKPDHYITEKEMLCIRFLIEEWDFGGIAK